MKKSKQNYYEQVKNNLNNLKNNGTNMRSFIAIKNSSASSIHMLTHKGATVTDPLHIAKIYLGKSFFSLLQFSLSSKWRVVIHSSYRCT